MSTRHRQVNNETISSDLQPWLEPGIAFERPLIAEAQDGIGPRGAPSGLLGPLSASGGPPNICD